MPDTAAILLGSGFADFVGEGKEHRVATPYGEPSAAVHEIDIAAHSVYALARHGDTHAIPPHAINYRANVYALKELGVDTIVAINTVGVVSSIRVAGQIAVPDQILDYTWGRQQTYYDGGDNGVEHIEFTEPFPAGLRIRLLEAATSAGVDCYDGGVYAATQGPRLESAAEIDRFERDGADFVGMTAMPEAALAAELGMDYACLALVVNPAAGRGEKPIHDDVQASITVLKTQTIAILSHFFARADGTNL